MLGQSFPLPPLGRPLPPHPARRAALRTGQRGTHRPVTPMRGHGWGIVCPVWGPKGDCARPSLPAVQIDFAIAPRPPVTSCTADASRGGTDAAAQRGRLRSAEGGCGSRTGQTACPLANRAKPPERGQAAAPAGSSASEAPPFPAVLRSPSGASAAWTLWTWSYMICSGSSRLILCWALIRYTGRSVTASTSSLTSCTRSASSVSILFSRTISARSDSPGWYSSSSRRRICSTRGAGRPCVGAENFSYPGLMSMT
mmetsp:Transcript_26804/g.48167  ORF Transcript_26804/g.48167 Transcript_26804/m.48167 type:complete len:255 (-) Transcript_26804:228-992(-)